MTLALAFLTLGLSWPFCSFRPLLFEAALGRGPPVGGGVVDRVFGVGLLTLLLAAEPELLVFELSFLRYGGR